MARKYERVQVQVSVDSAIYAIGDQLGTLFEIPRATKNPAENSELKSVMVSVGINQLSAMDLLLFSSQPTVTSTDNNAINIADAEIAAKLIGIVKFASTDWADLAQNAVGMVSAKDMVIGSGGGSQSMWGIFVSRGTPTYGASAAFQVIFGFEREEN